VSPFVPASRPAIGVIYSQAIEQVERIRNLPKPSVIAVVSISDLLLKTARSLLAPAIGRRHTLSEIVAVDGVPIDPGAADVVICDSVTMKRVRSKQKFLYRLIAADCLEHIAASIVLD
jgi:hypothetical protein